MLLYNVTLKQFFFKLKINLKFRKVFILLFYYYHRIKFLRIVYDYCIKNILVYKLSQTSQPLNCIPKIKNNLI